MSRVTLHTLDSAPEAAKPYLETAQKNAGFIPNLLGILANAPAALETYVTVSGINGKAELTLPEREVVQLIAATRHGCDFCVAGHTAVAQNKAKLPDEVVTALRGQTELPERAPRSAGRVYPRSHCQARGRQRRHVQRIQGRRFHRRAGAGSDSGRKPGNLVQFC